MDIKLYTTMDFLPDAQIRDRDNDHPESDPIDLVWDVHFRLIFVLFRGRDYGTEPFHLPDGITSWHWAVDIDFDRSTSPLIEGDDAEIEAVETDTETRIIVPFTVNGAQLESMLAGRSYAEGMIGELVGNAPVAESHIDFSTFNTETNTFGRVVSYVNRAVFCMQVPGIRVWNRIV